VYHDPFVPEILEDGHTPAGAVGKSAPLTDKLLKSADAVLVVTDHSSIDYAHVCRTASIVIDSRNACGGHAARGPATKSAGQLAHV
jgi:UDP-N-acetyl-D-glucosamine dehydrogenase